MLSEQTNGGPDPTLSIVEVSKSFTAVRALKNVSLDARPGEVLALMGENGAGKSTLLRIINGDHQPDSGRMLLEGVAISPSTPSAAHALGIRVIAQEPEIVPHVDVAENIYAGAIPNRGRFYSRRRAHQQARADLQRFGFADLISPATLGRRLSPAQRQIVEIMRGLVGEVKVIAFDEPTSSLSDPEVDILFAMIDRLRRSGIAVIYVSHRMKEIFRISDRIAVLRDGAVVDVRRSSDTTEDELVRMMVGRDVDAMFRAADHTAGDVVLTLQDVSSADVSNISLDVRAGEIVALAGLVGAGRSELARAVVGDVPLTGGSIVLSGRRLRLRSPRDAVRQGIGYAPEERKSDALIMGRTVRDNISLASLDRLRRFRFVTRRKENAIARDFVDSLHIRTPGIEQQVGKLSGGNQQKVVLARWLTRKPQLLILDEPTRGVDVGAKAEIYAIINQLALDGTAILLISSEMLEVIGLADRILVMRGGRIAGELPAGASEEQIVSLAMIHDLPVLDADGVPA